MLDALYTFLSRIDRKFTVKRSLPYPVLSVGNISSGGRAKSPMVSYLARGLKDRGFAPVILTRGYKRDSKEFVEINENNYSQRNVAETGDEALELFLKTEATVLVSQNRYQSAHRFLRDQMKCAPWVFILDDGFQHWALKRDFDLVLYNTQDLVDRILPMGRLREGPKSLERSDLSLMLGKDILKESFFVKNENLPSSGVSLTTRVKSADYSQFIRASIAKVQEIALPDHAPKNKILRALKSCESHDSIFLGMKEAVKMIDPERLKSFYREGFLEHEIEEKRWHLYLVDLKLQIKDEENLWKKIEGVL